MLSQSHAHLGAQQMALLGAQAGQPMIPAYYLKDIMPTGPLNSTTIVQLREDFLTKLTGKYTSASERERMYKMPVPPELGQVQLTIDRHNTGFSKLWPKYVLSVSEQQLYPGHSGKSGATAKSVMLEAKLAKSTKTPYYRIEMVNSGGKFAIADDAYIGKLRSNP